MWTEIISQKIVFDIFIAFVAGFLGGYGVRFLKRRKEKAREKSIEGYVRGISYIIDDETDKAIEELVKVATDQPDLIDVYLSIGNLFRKKGEFNRALIVHKSLLGRPHLSCEKKADIFTSIGVDYKKAGLYSRAKEAFKKALELNPLDKQVHKLLEEVYEDSRDWESLARWQRRFGLEGNVVAHLYTEWGKELFAGGNLDRAQEKLKKAFDSDESCVDACLWLGKVYMAGGKQRKAYEIWKKAVVEKPSFSHLILENIEDKGKLKETIKEMLIKNKTSIYALYFAACSYERIAEPLKALSLYRFLFFKRGFKGINIARRLLNALSLLGKGDGSIQIMRESLDYVSDRGVKYVCTRCGFISSSCFWRCPQCKNWDTVKVEI